MKKIDEIKHLLRFKIWSKIKANFIPDRSSHSFYYSHSQFGEDMILRFLTNNRNHGFYVDIGAFHPIYLSNTFHFYDKGWHGINIDARRGSMELFNLLRPRDINLELCISNKEGETTFFVFDQPPFNTCDQSTAEKLIAEDRVKLVEKYTLKTLTLSSILDKYMPSDVEVDFMSIDVEGLDEIVLMSNNWEKFKPKILVFEKHQISFQDVLSSPIVQYLELFGYKFITKCGFSIIMAQKDYLKSIQLDHF